MHLNSQGLGCCSTTTIAGDIELPGTIEGSAGAAIVDDDLGAVGIVDVQQVGRAKVRG